jgi:hypothetical protein
MADQHRFSPSAGWDEVRQILGREIQLLVALAGVFFLLPGLALSFLLPTPENVTSIDQIVALVRPYLPLILLISLVQMVGQLAIWTLLLSADRPTVGEAIKAALYFLPFFFLINLVANIIVALGLIVFILPGLYLWARLAPVGAVAVAEQHRSPITAIQRSFAVTKANALPVFAFLLIVLVVFLIISMVVSLVFGTAFALAGLDMGPGGTGAALLAVVSGIVSAAGSTVFTLMQLVIYRQLTGVPSPQVFG